MKRSLKLSVLPTACLCAAAYFAMPAAAAETKQTGWKTENGKRYYYDADGKKVTGAVAIDGITYVFAPNGAQQLGWQTVDSKRFYYDADGKAVFGWLDWRGERYYISKKNGKLTGSGKTDEGEAMVFDEYGVCDMWQPVAGGGWTVAGKKGEVLIDGDPYLFDEKSILLTGWQTAKDGITRYYDAETHSIRTGWIQETDGKLFYADADKGKVTGFITDADGKRFYVDKTKGRLTGWNIIDGKQYKLLDDGEVFTGLYTVTGKTYLFGEDGVMVTGFAETADGRRYFSADNGVMVTGLCVIDENTYFFDQDGIMQTGFQDIPAANGSTVRMFFDTDGKRRDGWVTIDGKQYYINPDGSIAVKPTEIDGKMYLFDQNGDVVKGWYTAEDGKKYYAGTDGVLVTGWQTIEKQKYYFDENCAMAAAPTAIGGKTYLFDTDGKLVVGWYSAANGKYYSGTDGVMLTGWQTIGNVKYYFNANGTMANVPTSIGGKVYLFKNDGTVAVGLYTDANGKKYYGAADGAALIGWQELPNQSSYFGADGVMVVSATIDGYTIDANGAARNDRATKADNLIKATAGTVYAVYQKFCSTYSYKEIEVARTTDQLLAAGWDKLIDTCNRRSGGVCYNLAAALDFTFKRAGFTSRVIYAWHGSHHYWVQVLIDNFWWNYDPTYGMQRCHITLAQQSQFDKNNGRPGYTVKGYVDAMYDKKGALLSAKFTAA